MYKVLYYIPGTSYKLVWLDRYLILDGETICPIRQLGKNYIVKLNWFNGYRNYNVSLILILYYTNCNIPVNKFHLLEVIYRDGNSLNLNLENLFYRFKYPILVEGYTDRYYIPYYTTYYIKKDGSVYNKKGKLLKPYVTFFKNDKKNRTGGYSVLFIRRDKTNKPATTQLHRLLGLAFLRYSSCADELVIDHIDGNPKNNDLSNLEWVTRAENNQRAYDNNLFPNKVINICYYNWKTNKKLYYNSIASVCKDFGFSHGYVKNRIDKKNKYIDGNCFLTKDKENEIIDYLIHPNSKIFSMGVKMACKATNIITKKVYKADNIMELARMIDVNTTSISEAIKTNNKKPVKKFIIEPEY